MRVRLETLEGALFFHICLDPGDIIFYFASITVISDGDSCDLACVVCVVCNFVIDAK